jgi:hypothetical protein
MPGEAFGLYRGDRGRNAKDLGRLGQAHDIILEHLAIDRLDTEGHLRLLIDEDQLAVVRSQHFKFWIAHDVFHSSGWCSRQ